MNEEIIQVAQRLRGMREIMGLSMEAAANAAGMPTGKYAEYEEGKHDFSFSFLFNMANLFRVDITDLLTGEHPRLQLYSFVRKGEGFKMERRKEYAYQHLARSFRDRKAEPFLVTVKRDTSEKPLPLNSHEGQELNYVIEGRMSVTIEDKTIEMAEGDTLYFDARHGHAMKAMTDECRFLAVIIK
jgi:transcriptional regulator with XRE-family HTH domain